MVQLSDSHYKPDSNKSDKFIFRSLSIDVVADSSIKLASTVFGSPNALYQVIYYLFQLWRFLGVTCGARFLSHWGHRP